MRNKPMRGTQFHSKLYFAPPLRWWDAVTVTMGSHNRSWHLLVRELFCGSAQVIGAERDSLWRDLNRKDIYVTPLDHMTAHFYGLAIGIKKPEAHFAERPMGFW